MTEYNPLNSLNQEEKDPKSILDQVLREGARKMLQAVIEAEVEEFIENYRSHKDDNGHRLVVRNGHHREREIMTGLGSVKIKQPRVDDRKLREKYDGEKFTSDILPRYMICEGLPALTT